ncbi:MAG: hypothetical protein GW947_02805 [Candidatus Pacebacteria bacterium]|nr:hypothetical protein [Candidatus Paceibacterota bacterium]PIR61038.1 MAG: hypothetical protein COU68_01575 [Candidatus Pacebacteria bacterium CG10_big_fil_rev_8_21_14_0_10_45_6]
MSSTLFFLAIVLILSLLFLMAIKRVRDGSFYGDTFWLLPLGVYVWGDALILLPFWILVSAVCLLSGVSGLVLTRLYLIFIAVRSAYEVVYWLLHQATKDTYRPPLIHKFTSLPPREGAILYQLAHMCMLALTIWLLLLL